MQLLSDDEAAKWCAKLGFRVDGELPSTRIEVPGSAPRQMRIRLSADAISHVGLAYTLLMTGVPGYEEERFAGGLLWLQRWEIWSEQIDRAGYLLLDGIRAGSAPAPDLDAAPALLFAEGELANAHACVSLPMIFQWDAHFVPASGEFFAFVSHEGRCDLVVGDERLYEELLERFQNWGAMEVETTQRNAW
jgi:hypothetical protein